MTLFWDRKVVLTITPQIGLSKRWENLRISFDVAKTNDGEPNTANIDIYNLSRVSREFIQTQGHGVILEAGYGDVKSIIFIGRVGRVYVRREPPDIITVVESNDGLEEYARKTISTTLGPGTTVRSVMRRLESALGISVGHVPYSLMTTEVYQNGVTMHGPVSRYLDDVCRRIGATWSIQDEELQIVQDGEPTPNSAVVVSAATGLVGSPEEMTKKTRSGTLEITGIRWVMLLTPGLNPGRLCLMQSRDFNGYYVTQKVRHQGDSGYDQAFYTESEGTERRLRVP